MATVDFKGNNEQALHIVDDREPVDGTFKSFEWLDSPDQHDREGEITTIARDISAGIAFSLELLEDDFLSRESGQDTLLSRPQIGLLLRHIRASAQLLDKYTARHCDYLNWKSRRG